MTDNMTLTQALRGHVLASIWVLRRTATVLCQLVVALSPTFTYAALVWVVNSMTGAFPANLSAGEFLAFGAITMLGSIIMMENLMYFGMKLDKGPEYAQLYRKALTRRLTEEERPIWEELNYPPGYSRHDFYS